jgi:predicted amidophosphoribosyltransferase
MARVSDLTALYENFLYRPRAGPGVCTTCFNFTSGYERCYACTRSEAWLDAVAPISYSPAHEQLHHVLAAYKRRPGKPADRFAVDLAALLWRYLIAHERCLGARAGAERFAVVAAVPSGDRDRDRTHPLRRIVGELVAPTRDRHERLLRRSSANAQPHSFSADRYTPSRPLAGEAVLLIDDTWTTGANAQSAAAALKRAGAGRVAAVVIGRHVNRGWHENDRHLKSLAGCFGWERCALCTPSHS